MTSVTGTARVTVQTPAKINLALAVGPPRADGFHPLATVYQAISLYDQVTATPAPRGQITLTLDPSGPLPAGDLASVPTDERNLAVRAARLLAERTRTSTGVHLRLSKAIPVAGGLAGGSADAAAALVGCNHLWGTGLSGADLRGLGAELGSDVPFCLLGGTALGYGRGEQVSPVLARGDYHWVLALDKQGLPTPAVYAELDRLRAAWQHQAGGGPGGQEPREDREDEPQGELTDLAGLAGLAAGPGLDVSDDLMNALRSGDVAALGRAMSNDLEPAAISLRPDLSEVLRLRPTVAAYGAVVSGSGPTCLFLAHDEAQAHRICAGLTAAGVPAVHRAVGPVPGARVVA